MCLVSVPSGILLKDVLSSAPLTVPDSAERDGIPFDEGAVIPNVFLPYAGVDAAPLAIDESISLERSASMVSLLKFDRALVPLLGRGLIASNEAEAATLAGCFPHEAVVTSILDSARLDFVWSRSRLHLIGLNRNMPGLRATTVNERRRCRLGLHFDSWDQLPITMRHRSRYRLSVNVGAGDRFFLFMAITANDVLAIMKDQMEKAGNATTMLRAALQHNRHRVYRLRVPPLWGYIAQTDFVPHDGSTLGAEMFDFSFHLLADFRPRRNYFQASSFYHISG